MTLLAFPMDRSRSDLGGEVRLFLLGIRRGVVPLSPPGGGDVQPWPESRKIDDLV